MSKTTNKIIASMLVLILTLAQLSLIGIYGKEVYATDSNLEAQGVATNNENVEFDAYFIVDEKETHMATSKISGGNKIYAKIKVNNTGYLKNAQIQFKDSNFKLINQTKNTNIQKIDAENGVILLNQINSNKGQVIEIPIEFNYSEELLLSEISRESKVVFTGNYIDKDAKEIKIEKEIKLQQNWREYADDMEASIKEDVTKFIPYTIGDKEGLLIQTSVETSLVDNKMPIKKSTIEATVPTLNGIKPESIKVYAISTEATNGQETALDFTNKNYTYNDETNILTITVENKQDENGKISWVKNVSDKYKIVYTYSKEVKEYVQSKDFKETLNLETKVILDLHTYGETQESKTLTQELERKNQIGNIAEVSIDNEEQSLSKGYIYANYSAQDKVETLYNQEISAEVVSVELTDKIVIEQNEEYFVKDETTKYPANTYYKSISIDKDIMNKILGENAEIKIYNGETLLEKINNEKTTIDLSNYNISAIKIETSKPVAEGQLIINTEKAIKGTLDCTKAQMQEVQKLSTIVKATVSGQEDVKTAEVLFTELETKAEIVIDKTDLSTILENENVQIKAILHTDNINNKLFKNPTLTIKLPKYIETIEIKDKEVLFDKELTINSVTTVENTDGTKSIVVELKGEQTKYSIDSVTGGTNVVITADLTVNRLTSNRTEEVVMSYTNQNTIAETKETKTNINFVAPTGVVTTSSIQGYAEGKEKLTAISGEKVTAQLQTLQAEREATFNMSVINNYDNTIDTIKILGRLPVKGSKNLSNGKDLGSTFDASLKSAITVTGVDETKVKVYYSTNVEATADIQKTENNWTATPENYETVKSYLIVVDETIKKAQAIDFTYTAKIPGNLQFNETAVENYIVYFKNNLETGTIEDKQLSAPITITTGLGPVLEATIESNYAEDQVVAVGNYIEYTVKVTNKGTLDAENAHIVVNVPEYTKYAQYNEENDAYKVDYETKVVTIPVEKIKVGETVEQKITLKVESSSSIEQGVVDKIKVKAEVISTNNDYGCETNEVTNSITQPYYYISNNPVENYGDLSEGEEFEFEVVIMTTSNINKSSNTMVKIPLPEGLTYVSANVKSYDYSNMKEKDENVKINYNKNTVIAEVGEVTDIIAKVVNLKVKVTELNNNEYKRNLKTYAHVSADGVQEETSEIKEYTITKVGLDVKQTSNIPNTTSIQAGDKLTYIITIKNIGQKEARILLEDKLPIELNYINMEYNINDETKVNKIINEQTIKQDILLPIGETVIVKINTVATILNENTDITNKPIIKVEGLEDIQGNEVKHTIEKFEAPIYDGEEDKENPNPTTNNKISGIIWEDENKNGMYDSNEKLFEGIEVLLLNMITNEFYNESVKTNENGIYTFTNLPKGTYSVIYLYDSGKYSATTYKAEGIDETVNSDAMDTEIVLGEQTLNVAITNNIIVEDKNIYNIDLGLIESPKFDLKLNKTISSITVQDPTGIKKYEYDNDKLVKVEFVEKYLGQTTIVVEYKITITNEGAVEGYVKKIADYIPSQMSFSSELNRDWYMNENGTIYNSSLANTKIQPGESKEVTLLLTKAVSENTLGTINNTAEIYEAYNDKGITDTDSTPANRASNEDDISSADMVLTIKTGKMVTFIGLSLAIVLTIGTSAYFIKKKVLG